MTDSSVIEYPLTLAPAVEAVSSSYKNFEMFLKNSEAASPKRDLNGDGRHDYVDDYIYTANFLVKKGEI